MQVIKPGSIYRLADGKTLYFLKSEPGVLPSGTTNEELLQVLHDRITFQQGQVPCVENLVALAGIQSALDVLEQRRQLRRQQGVEHTPVPHTSEIVPRITGDPGHFPMQGLTVKDLGPEEVEQVRHLFKDMAPSPGIQVIDLSGQKVSAAEIQAIADAFQHIDHHVAARADSPVVGAQADSGSIGAIAENSVIGALADNVIPINFRTSEKKVADPADPAESADRAEPTRPKVP